MVYMYFLVVVYKRMHTPASSINTRPPDERLGTEEKYHIRGGLIRTGTASSAVRMSTAGGAIDAGAVASTRGDAPAAALDRPNSESDDAFPTRVVVILALAMTVHSYTLVSLFPYVGMMVSDLLSLETLNEAGFYAGYVASAFTFGRFLSGYAWGHVTDSAGRKPVIVLGLMSIIIFSLTFGLSTSYAWAVSSRLILGLTNGIMAALRVSLNEVCGPKHVLVGMNYLNSCRAISMVVGTGVGGLLAQPAVHYPSLFSATGLFGRYPFLLPNLVGASCALVIMVLVIMYLPETKDYATIAAQRVFLQQQQPQQGQQQHASDGVSNGCSEAMANGTDTNRASRDEPPPSSPTGVSDVDDIGEEEEIGIFGRHGLLTTPHVKTLLTLGCVVQSLQIGFEEAYPLFALSTPDVGGLGWNTFQIGKVLVMTGLFMACFQLLFLPPLIKVVGITNWQRVGFCVGALAFIAIPSVRSFSWNYASLFSASVVVNTFASCGLAAVTLTMSVGSTTLVPSRMRGKLGGLYNMAESLGRFLGPAGFAISYAWSVSPSSSAARPGWVDFRFVFWASAVLLAMCAVLAWPTLTAENLMQGGVEDAVSASISPQSSGSSPRLGLGKGFFRNKNEQPDADVHIEDSLLSTVEIVKRETDMV